MSAALPTLAVSDEGGGTYEVFRAVLKHLWRAIDFHVSELLQIDFWVGLAAGIGAAIVALDDPAAILRADGVATGVVGVIIGAVIAGVSVQAAFFDQAFLRKLRVINREPVHYLAPFLFTAVIGVFAMLGLIVLSTLSVHSRPVVVGVCGGVTGFFTVWTITSLLPCLATLVQFIGLKMDALDVADDVDLPRRRMG